jgi:chromosome segregation ATPase
MSSRSSYDHFSGFAKKLAEQADQEQRDIQQIAAAHAQAIEAKKTLLKGTQDILANERKLEELKADLADQKADLAAYAEDISQYKRLNALDSYPNQA